VTSTKTSTGALVSPPSPRGPRSLFTQHTGQGVAGRLVVRPHVGPAAHLRARADGGESETPRADHSRRPAALTRVETALANTRRLLRESWRAVSAARMALAAGRSR
jgi:hypothetical protein